MGATEDAAARRVIAGRGPGEGCRLHHQGTGRSAQYPRRMAEWKGDYPWLQLAFRHVGRGGREASEEWRVRIADDLGATLDYKVRPDGTASVWCGMSDHGFHHEPTPKELLAGLADAYRAEAKRLGVRLGPVAVETRDGPVEISWAARDLLLGAIRARGTDEDVVHALEAAEDSDRIELDRAGKIVVFDALWELFESAEVDELVDPQLLVLRDRLKVEIAEGPAGPSS